MGDASTVGEDSDPASKKGEGRGESARLMVKRKTRRSEREEMRYDEMYLSPLDSSPEVFFVGLVLIFVASILTRLYKIDQPDHVA